MKYFRWKSSTFKIFTLLLHHILVHRYNFVVQEIRFWKKIFSFWNFGTFLIFFQGVLSENLRNFWSLRKIWSLSDRWAVWECIRVNISARVRTRKLKIGRRTELESYFQDLDIRHRYARGISYAPKICRFDFILRTRNSLKVLQHSISAFVSLLSIKSLKPTYF